METSISIIVLSSNNQHISLVLERLFQMVHDGDEIILVDDHSQEDYISHLEELRKKGLFHLIASSKRGNRAHNRNLGAKEAKNEVLLFLDGDIILCDNGLEILRQAHRSKTAVAFIGPKHAIHYSDIHIELYSALTHEDFIHMLKTPDGREAIYQNPLFRDYREDFFYDTKHSPYFWLYYYTGASSVEKNVFNQIGGFDEKFTTWGSEDVDLGYRISKHGSIGYLPQFHAIHIPHPRDILSIESTNAANILRMYEKYRTWEFEVVYSFSATAAVFNSMLCIIQQMQLIELTPIKVKPCNNSLIIETVSRSSLSGCIQYIDECGEYVGAVRHRESEWLDSSVGEIRQLRRRDWTLTAC